MIARLLLPSIGRRVFFALVLSCALVWVALYYVGRLGVNAPEVGNFDREMRLIANAATQVVDRYPDLSCAKAGLDGLAANIEWRERVHGTPKGLISFRITDETGTVVSMGGTGPALGPDRYLPDGYSVQKIQGESFHLLKTVSTHGNLSISVASSARAREIAFDELMLSAKSFFPLLYVLPLTVLPAWLAVWSGLRPLRKLSRDLALRKSDDLSHMHVQGMCLELKPLVSELNSAFDRVSALLQRERSFLADAAHELRTPLAVMLAQSDSLRNAPNELARESALRRLEGGLNRASRLVNQLLALARLEVDAEDGNIVVDVADVARECLAQHSTLARRQGVELSYVGPDSLVDSRPRHCLESVVDNLVSNAIRYGGPGAHVEVRLALFSSGHIHLSVRDDGPGIAPVDLPILFERFRRGANVASSGSGLGLAIVKSAARQLHASVEVFPGPEGKGTEFKVEWVKCKA